MSESQIKNRCPIDYALEVFGDRWTLIVLRDLMLSGKRHYRELMTSKEGIATNILASRLKKMEADGLVIRKHKPEDKRQVFYELTEKALDLVPVLLEISRWSVIYDKHTAAPPELMRRYQEEPRQLIADLQQAARIRQS
ncbi:helix-turn-helix transcriptional regulator [Methylomonas sp. EFPC1]|uniref:winged helix-turn-helix transcriptional regulator n=1 Tax=unclassified Methylomonas TaxID=2608980 RepID=UPI0019670A18|nr:helix-turn-helix domain-containing protein [Methylomonas sp. EFPC1]QSB03336.1 helix-turn-helix transcriptional regulator [Methylomonas sp. EFPC1]